MTTESAASPPARPQVGGLDQQITRVARALQRFVDDPGPDPVRRRDDWTRRLVSALPERGAGADATIEELLEVVVPNGARLMEPGWWGFVTCGPTTVPLAASVAAAVAGTQRYTITAFNLLEELSLDWLVDLLGLPSGMKGVYSSGGSTANLVALGGARQWACEQAAFDPARDGLGGVRLAVYTSEHAHHTVDRSAAVLGIGRAHVRHIPSDDDLRMRADLLDDAIAADLAAGVLPVAVVATAGTTDHGVVDPLRQLGEVAKRHGVWFHVDGAYGLPGILDHRIAELYDGLELADSAIVDPHKWLGVPVGVAATFVRDRDVLHRAFTQEPAAYLESLHDEVTQPESSLDSMGIPYADVGVELSAPARGVMVWSVLRELGREGVAARVRADDDLARRLADHARAHPRLELLLEPVTSICCLRYVPRGAGHDVDALNAAILQRLRRDTAYLPSSTRVRGSFALRPCFINARTTAEMVDAFADEVVRIGDELSERE